MKLPVSKSSVRLFLRTRRAAVDQEANLYHWDRDKNGEHLDASHWNRALRGLGRVRPNPTQVSRLRIG